MSMRLADNIAPDGAGVYVWVSRLATATMRPAEVLARWPALLSPLSKDQQIQYGVEHATHLLTGPVWPGRLIEAGDQVTRCAGRHSGFDYVRSGKSWSVVGRRRDLDAGDLSYQMLFVQEAI